MADVNICEYAINEYLKTRSKNNAMQAHIVHKPLSRYYISKSMCHCRFRRLSTDCKHTKMVSVCIRGVKMSMSAVVRRKSGNRRNYYRLLIRAALNFRHSTLSTPSVSASAYFNPRYFPSRAWRPGAFYHLASGTTVIAWISEAPGQLKIAELGIVRAETSV